MRIICISINITVLYHSKCGVLIHVDTNASIPRYLEIFHVLYHRMYQVNITYVSQYISHTSRYTTIHFDTQPRDKTTTHTHTIHSRYTRLSDIVLIYV